MSDCFFFQNGNRKSELVNRFWTEKKIREPGSETKRNLPPPLAKKNLLLASLAFPLTAWSCLLCSFQAYFLLLNSSARLTFSPGQASPCAHLCLRASCCSWRSHIQVTPVLQPCPWGSASCAAGLRALARLCFCLLISHKAVD